MILLRVLSEKLKEVFSSVAPIVVIVLILHFTIIPLPMDTLLRFLIGSLFIVLGLAIFLFGIDVGITPLGKHIVTSMFSFNKLWIIVLGGLLLGFFISIAEPDLQILATQVSSVTNGLIPNITLLIVVCVGIAIMLVVGLLRIVYNISISLLLLIIYGIIGILAIFTSPEFLAISFDASGATTGALTVPFILAVSAGISAQEKDSRSSEADSFGLLAVTSAGAILGVILMGFANSITGLTGTLPDNALDESTLFSPFTHTLPEMCYDSIMALLPVVVIFVLAQIFILKLEKKPFKKILKGLLYTCIGLVLFLTGVNAGFMNVGRIIGQNLATNGSPAITIIVGFVLGLVTILAEPAVHVLTNQVEDVTGGYIKPKIIFAALALGVGSAVAFSILRIYVSNIQLWHILLPGYCISLILSFIVPKLFVGIAFDSGGVASGPMTATFILAFAQGVAGALPNADVLRDAFGTIALVAMTPIITLQILGLIVQIKSKKKRVIENE